MRLRDYQSDAVQAIETAWQTHNSTLAVICTGGGKTIIAAHVIDRAPQGRVMFLAHREELIWQAQAKIKAVTGVEPGVEMADYRADSHIWGKHRVIVSSVQTQYSGMDGAGRMSQFDPNEFSVLIADECFPAGTLIDGKPIEDICVGDYVRSYNHSNGRIERQRVARLFCRQSKHLIKLSFTNGRSLVCTPNHPIFSVTRGEYVPAYLLNCQDEVLNDVSYQVHSMRPSIRGNQCPTHMLAGMPNGETNRAPHTTPCTSVRYMRNTCSLYNTHAAGRSEAGQGVLLSRMPAYCAIENIISDYGENQPQVRFWPHEIQQPHEKPFNSCEGIGCYDRSLANPADGQWDRTDLTRGGVIPSAWMGNKCCSKDKDANGVWISHLLQDRRGVQRNDGGNRSGWQFTQAACEASPRSQKGTFLNVTRVAHIEILESRSRSKFRAMPSNCEVFNIEVEQNHNYFANGILVHNCHHYVSSAYKRVIDYYRQNPNLKVLGITATPNRADKLAMGAIFQSVAFTFDILAGIDHGWLVPIDQQLVTVENLDLSNIHTVAGDLNQGELSQVLEDEKNLHDIAAPVVQIVGNRKTLIFCASLKQAERVCEIINRLKPESARWVHGGTPKEERRILFSDYANRKFQFLVNVGIACLDEQTEILTTEGWIGYRDITHDHQIANWDEGKIFFDKPLAIEIRDRRLDERMVVLETRNRSIRVTDDHRMLYRTWMEGSFKVARAKELANKACALPISGFAEPFDVAPEQELQQVNKRRISANSYHLRKSHGLTYEQSITVATNRAKKRAGLRYKSPAELTERECEFIGFWLGDGTKSKLQTGGVEYLLWQAESYQNLVKWIDSLLSDIGIDACRRLKKPRRAGGSYVVQWSLSRGTGFGPQSRQGVYPLEPYLNKSGSPLLWGLRKNQFAALIRGFWMADGEHGDSVKPISDGWRICNTNRSLFDLLQAIGCCRGYRANISDGITNTDDGHKPLWRLSISLRDQHHMTKHRMHFEDGWKAEKVWCVKSHTGFIVTRRRGTVTVTGNTEGFDDPGVEVVVMARPTKSTSLYTQVIGRGTRPLAGLVDQYDDPEDRKIAIAESSKQAVLIIDMVGNSGKHKLITSADILGGKYPEEVIAKAKAKAESQAVDMRQALEEAAEELAKEREEQQRREATKRAQVKAKATYSTRKVDPFDILDLQPHRDTGWDTGKPLTEKMVEFLEQRGVNTGDLSYAEAGRLINEIKRRYETGECSYKQAKLLKKYGLPTNAKRTEAKEWIDAIAANGWKLPAELDAMREPMEIF